MSSYEESLETLSNREALDLQNAESGQTTIPSRRSVPPMDSTVITGYHPDPTQAPEAKDAEEELLGTMYSDLAADSDASDTTGEIVL